MYTEDRSFDKSNGHEIVKDLRAVLPWISVTVFAHAFVIETILH